MTYSNGFDLDAILPVLTSRVGWRSETLVRSFESFHALCTEQNLRDVQPTAGISDSDFTAYKTQIKKDIIQRCLSAVFSKPEYIDQVLLHNRVENTARTAINNTNSFTGIRFRIPKAFDISVWVKTVTLLFDSAVTFNLYLYQEGNPTAITSIPVTTVANTPTTVDVADILLSYSKTGSQTFYLGYKQSEIGGAKAIQETVCWSCASFGAVSFIMPESAISQFVHGITLSPVGINAEVHTFRDYTGKIEKSAHLFDEVMGLSMVAFVIEQILACTRSNATERILKGGIEKISLDHYLNGSVPAPGVAKTTGLKEVIDEKMEDLREAFYPCVEAQTISVCS